MLGSTLAVCAGVSAACASAFAKLAMSGEEIALLCQNLQSSVALRLVMPPCSVVTLILRGMSLSLLFLFNAIMWNLFAKSLQQARSSLETTITTTSANLFFTAVIGYLVFGESLSLTWGLGSSFIIVGLRMIHRGGNGDAKHKDS